MLQIIGTQAGMVLSWAVVTPMFGIASRYFVVSQTIETKPFLTYYVGMLSRVSDLFTQ